MAPKKAPKNPHPHRTTDDLSEEQSEDPHEMGAAPVANTN
jgi:hypothetical protein